MYKSAKISLGAPDNSAKYFSFRILQKLYNEPCVTPMPDKLLVISDIEGNFLAFSKLLQNNGVIDKNFKWRFGKGHLVIVGDCFDRGEQVIECLWLIYSLEQRARQEEGYVHFILGNHEIMNMNGDWRYVHPKYALKSEKARHPSVAMYSGNSELWRWLQTKNVIEKIGDLLFVHGGICPELLANGLTISELNSLTRKYYTKGNELFTEPVLQLIYNSKSSPFWFRGYYQDEIKEADVDLVLKYFGVSTIITGHTIVEQVSTFFNGKVINVDTDHAAGISEALFIMKDQFFRVTSLGEREKIK